MIHYPIPQHKQKCYIWNGLEFAITEQIHAEELSMPISPVLSSEKVSYVIDIVNAWV